MRNIAAPVLAIAAVVLAVAACQPSAPSVTDSPAAAAPSASAVPTLATSCQLGYRWGSAETFIPENATEWWKLTVAYTSTAFSGQGYTDSVFAGTVAQLAAKAAQTVGFAGETGPYSSQQQAQQGKENIFGNSTLADQYDTAVQVTAANGNAVPVSASAVNYTVSDVAGDQLGSDEAPLNVVSIAPGVTLTSSTDETLGTSPPGKAWISGTSCTASGASS